MAPFSKWKVFLSLVSWHSFKVICITFTCIYVAGWVVPASWWCPMLRSEESDAICGLACNLPVKVQRQALQYHPYSQRSYFQTLYEEEYRNNNAGGGGRMGIDCWQCVATTHILSAALWWLFLALLYILYYCRISVGTTQLYYLPTSFNTRLTAAMDTLPTYDACAMDSWGSHMTVPNLNGEEDAANRKKNIFLRVYSSHSILHAVFVVIGGSVLKAVFKAVVKVFAPSSMLGSRHTGGTGYVPTPFLTNPDAQTLFAAAGRPSPKTIPLPPQLSPSSPRRSTTKEPPVVSFDRELVQGVYTDGEICVLDWSLSPLATDLWGRSAAAGKPNIQNFSQRRSAADTIGCGDIGCDKLLLAPVIILFHGLTGGSDDSNLHYLSKLFNLKGWHVVIPVRRGCAEENITVTGFKSLHYPYGDKVDTELAVRYISRKMKGHPLFACGLSAGSNVMCNYLAKRGEASRIRGGVSVANGYCWIRGTTAIRRDHPVWDAVMSGVVYTMLCKRHSEFFTTPNRTLETFGQVGPIPTTAAVATATHHRRHRRHQLHHQQHHSEDDFGRRYDQDNEEEEEPVIDAVNNLVSTFVGVPIASATLSISSGSPTAPFPTSTSSAANASFPSLQEKSYKAKSVTMSSSKTDFSDSLYVEPRDEPRFGRGIHNISNGEHFHRVAGILGFDSSFKDDISGGGAAVPSSSSPHAEEYGNDDAEQEKAAAAVIRSLAEEFRLGRIGSVQEYDAAVSRRVHGYNTLEDFYNDQSCVHNLHRVRVPTIFLNALDDPLASQDNIPYHLFAPTSRSLSSATAQRLGGDKSANPNLILVTTPSGGHLGWAEAMWPFAEEPTYMDRFIVQALSFMIREYRLSEGDKH